MLNIQPVKRGRPLVAVDNSQTQNRLRELRLAKGYSQKQLAQFLNVEQPAISQAERKGTGIGDDKWFALADLLDVDPRDLKGHQRISEKISV